MPQKLSYYKTLVVDVGPYILKEIVCCLKGLQTLTCLIKGPIYLFHKKRSTMPNMQFIMVSVLSNFYLALPVSY